MWRVTGEGRDGGGCGGGSGGGRTRWRWRGKDVMEVDVEVEVEGEGRDGGGGRWGREINGTCTILCQTATPRLRLHSGLNKVYSHSCNCPQT